MAHSVTLHHYWRSSSSWRVRWALALKDIRYHSAPVNLLKGEQLDPLFLKLNPAGFVPTLVVDNSAFGESLAIMEWLDEVYPTPSLLPKDPLLRMHTRQLALTIVAGTQPHQNLAQLKMVTKSEDERKAYAAKVIERGLAVYESLLTAGPGRPGTFSVGDSVTMADLCLVPQVYNALRFDVEMAKFPLCAGIYERCLQTEACDMSAPHRQPGAQ